MTAGDVPKANSSCVVIDTSVWLSGLVFGGNLGQVLELFAEGRLHVVISEEQLTELRRKITEKFPLFVPQLGLLEASLRQDAKLVPLGSQSVTICRDPDDNKFIETAQIGNCGYIISGYNGLLATSTYESIRILRPAEFLELV